MSQIIPIFDEWGVIRSASKELPEDSLKVAFVEALAELQDAECHRTRSFPKTGLHRVRGIKLAVYRADVRKGSAWRLHVQYANGQIHLKDLIPPSEHDSVLRVIMSKKQRYE